MKAGKIVWHEGLWYETGNNGHGLVDLHSLLTGQFVKNVLISECKYKYK